MSAPQTLRVRHRSLLIVSWLSKILHEERFELSTKRLRGACSTAELLMRDKMSKHTDVNRVAGQTNISIAENQGATNIGEKELLQS